MSDISKFFVKKRNVNDEFIIVISHHVQVGDEVNAGDLIVEIENAKDVFEINAEEKGFIAFIAPEGSEVPVGDMLWALSVKKEIIIESSFHKINSEVIYSKKALKLINKHNLDKKIFIGKKIVRALDVLNVIDKSREELKDDIVEVKLNHLKRREINNIQQASREIIYSKVTTQIPITFIQNIQNNMKKRGIEASSLNIMAFAVAKTLKKFPLLNSYFLDNKIFTYNKINIGLAINAGKGLKVVVLSDADQMDLEEIVEGCSELFMEYMRNESFSCMEGTFTISDLSLRGVIDFNPIINMRQSGILGICANDITNNFFNLVLGFDHQVCDGLYAADFFQEIKKELILAGSF